MNSRQIIRFLRNNELFRDLDFALLEQIAGEAQWMKLRPGEVLFNEGDVADAMYLAVAPGLVVSFFDDEDLEQQTTVTPLETVGEMQFITGGRRTAGIHAEDFTSVIKLPISLLDALGDKRGLFLEKLNRTVHRRLLFNDMARLLPQLFGALEKDEIIAIMKQSELVTVRRGDMLFHQDDLADGFYVLMTGYMAVEKRQPDGEITISTYIKRGGLIGEMGMLAEEGRNFRAAGIRAMRDSELYKFPSSRFDQFLKQYPKLLLQISRILAERLRTQDRSRKKQTADHKLIAVMPQHPNVPLHDFTLRLQAALSRYSATTLINSQIVDQQLATPGISQVSDSSHNRIRVTSWLHDQERNCDFILMETDNTLTPWSRRCLRLADHVIVLANGAQEDKEFSELEDYLFGAEHTNEQLLARSSLVLLHPDANQPPQDTLQWLTPREPDQHFHVRWDREDDLERLARHLSGNSIGLVLSGGGARGFAHIGVIRAMQQQGIPIDVIGGTSMGALIAAEHALGWDVERMTQVTGDSVGSLLFDYTLPLTSLFNGRRMVHGMKRLFGELPIEDMWLPYFCVSSNLTRASQQVHQHGPLWQALLATNAAPGILPPVVLEGDLHVDGALLNNLPADVMDERCTGKVIAIDVSPAVDLNAIHPYGEGLSGWRILWHRLNPFIAPINMPSIRSILMRSGELASISTRQKMIKEHADLYLKMPVENFQPDDYKLVGEIVHTGYDYTHEHLQGFINQA